MDKVLIVAGPTASGKSSLAFQLAQERNGVILNGDSLQVYRGLEILTAQPSLEHQQTIPHRLYGFLDPKATCSVGMWRDLVLSEIKKIHEGRKLPIVVGGTGLYLKSLVEGMADIPPTNGDFRKRIESQDKSQESLYAELQKVDADLATRINPHDKQRTLRGLDVFYGTGKPLSFWQSQKSDVLPYEFEKILLMPSRKEEETRIAKRLEDMLQCGALEEIKAFLALSPSLTAMKAIGLREFGAYLKGECSLERAKELTFFHTRQYAKRQRTWFRHQFQADRVVESHF